MSEQAAPAAHSSFYTAMRILPAPQREAMYALYGFCRAVDDIADERGPATASQRLAELERWRGDVAAMFAGRAPPVSPPSPKRRGTSTSSKKISTR